MNIKPDPVRHTWIHAEDFREARDHFTLAPPSFFFAFATILTVPIVWMSWEEGRGITITFHGRFGFILAVVMLNAAIASLAASRFMRQTYDGLGASVLAEPVEVYAHGQCWRAHRTAQEAEACSAKEAADLARRVAERRARRQARRTR